MVDYVFRSLTRREKSPVQQQYLKYLKRRNGLPDLAERRFSTREEFFTRLAQRPVRWQGTPLVARSVFERNIQLSRPEADLDVATLWALAVAKCNRLERFGIEYRFSRYGVLGGANLDVPEPYVEIEEFYHTRILVDILHCIGIDMPLLPPPLAMVTSIKALANAPRWVSRSFVFLGEILGVVGISSLRNIGRTLFAAQPHVAEQVETLFNQILVDEIGHVHYLRSQLTACEMRLVRVLRPFFAGFILTNTPEYTRIVDKTLFMQRVRDCDLQAIGEDCPDVFRPFTPRTTSVHERKDPVWHGQPSLPCA